jgi:hypothetical protein
MSIGRLDINTAVMTLPSFQAASRQEHIMEHTKRVSMVNSF